MSNKIQIRLSKGNVNKINEVIIPEYYKEYPILQKHDELTQASSVDDGIAFLIKFWEDNWERGHG